MLELRPRGIPPVVDGRRADGGRVRKDIDAFAAAAVLPVSSHGREWVRHGAARVAVREVPESSNHSAFVMAARPVRHLAARAETHRRVRRAEREEVGAATAATIITLV
ncbi:hypothetical protein RRF57_000186 [Xylaria bambusicola]|uniref:Uncharacterized protein n=1 Tax=Xylaria bambusicola TaxID=326684 RepID=A0AAN7YTY4_9PEZI